MISTGQKELTLAPQFPIFFYEKLQFFFHLVPDCNPSKVLKSVCIATTFTLEAGFF
ncbi:hypothetical protein PROVALCAL_01417 [Providencia alcalifaciens DSM 30120]|uniref:Uncharacterized protein n=1 Tax=Providencia alcalifaciens DSM 30120 TaxID=520999 RepID=B6XDJ5_9GAMM|nr:hypothetical protein PROVALCAL_01417 [Providencia alcalifaciens DSM 30120]